MTKRLMTRLTAAAVVLVSLATGASATEADVPEALRQRVEAEGWSQQWHDALYEHEDAAVGAAVRQMLRAKRDAEALASGLVVHEWGAMQHHMGTSTSEFDLIGEDQSDLPAFVQVWADQPVQRPQIILKPIIYFYTQKPRTVEVLARFPAGVLTQWYPSVTFFTPERLDPGRRGNNPNPPLRNGSLVWKHVELDPDRDTSRFARVDENHPWWHIARDTDATPVRVVNPRARRAQQREAVERFLFYRGAGEYKPMVMPKRDKPGVDLSVRVPFSQIDLRGVFLVRVNDSGATITHAPVLRAKSTLELAGPDAAKPIELAAETAKAQFIESLEAAGLFPKEARGLVEIWGDDMFTTPGERLLYLMPSNEAERVMPLEIRPAPSSTVRTLISWVELSTPEAEKRIMDLVKKLGSDAWAERQAAETELRQLDRFAEAILRRTLNTTRDEEVRLRIEQILAALEQKRRQGKATNPPNKP